MSKKLKRATGLEGIEVFEALERLASTDPKELRKIQEQHKKLKEDGETFSKSVEDDQNRVMRRLRSKGRYGKGTR